MTPYKSLRFSNNIHIRTFKSNDEEYAQHDSRLSCSSVSLWEKIDREAHLIKSKGYGILLRDCFQGPEDVVQDNINAFARLPEEVCGRGLEKYLSRQHDEERLRVRETAKNAVLSGQKSLKNQGKSSEQISTKLAATLREYSLSAKLFARRLAIADELAVKHDENLVAAQELVKDMLSLNAKQVIRQPSFQDSFTSDRSGSSISSYGDGIPAKLPPSPPLPLMSRVEATSTFANQPGIYQSFDCYNDHVSVQQKSSAARTA